MRAPVDTVSVSLRRPAAPQDLGPRHGPGSEAAKPIGTGPRPGPPIRLYGFRGFKHTNFEMQSRKCGVGAGPSPGVKRAPRSIAARGVLHYCVLALPAPGFESAPTRSPARRPVPAAGRGRLLSARAHPTAPRAGSVWLECRGQGRKLE